MSESDVGKALLKVDALDLAGVPDSQQLTWKILEHDRRLVRRLTALTSCRSRVRASCATAEPPMRRVDSATNSERRIIRRRTASNGQ